ncbi:MAG: MarR family transcriptional regulator [Clostridia bacterium]|nr:MarR family transcriptional regulator [Clostridia bacterium]
MNKSEYYDVVNGLLNINVLIRKAVTFPGPRHLDGISKTQFFVLSVLYDKGEHSMGAMANKVGVSGSQLTGLVDGLVRLGYIDRVVNEANRRSVLIHITDEGRNALDESRRQTLELILPQFEELSTEDVERLREGTNIVTEILVKMGERNNNRG